MPSPRGIAAAHAAGFGLALLVILPDSRGAAASDPWLPLLRPGVVAIVHSQSRDAADDYELRLRAKGGTDLDCILSGLEADAFRTTFDPEAMAHGDAVLGVTQTNPEGARGR